MLNIHIEKTVNFVLCAMTRSEAGKLGAIKANELGVNRDIHTKCTEEYYKNPKRCMECGSVIPYEKRRNGNFCSQHCSAIFTNKKRGHKQIKRCTKKCVNCGRDIKNAEPKRKFCSLKCQQEYIRKKKFEQVEKTGMFLPCKDGEASRPFVKTYLINKFGRKCSICGITTWCGKDVPLIVDHMDGNSLNNNVDNFRLVCGNCDMQLPTYKNKNRGNGRKLRRLKNSRDS